MASPFEADRTSEAPHDTASVEARLPDGSGNGEHDPSPSSLALEPFSMGDFDREIDQIQRQSSASEPVRSVPEGRGISLVPRAGQHGAVVHMYTRSQVEISTVPAQISAEHVEKLCIACEKALSRSIIPSLLRSIKVPRNAQGGSTQADPSPDLLKNITITPENAWDLYLKVIDEFKSPNMERKKSLEVFSDAVDVFKKWFFIKKKDLSSMATDISQETEIARAQYSMQNGGIITGLVNLALTEAQCLKTIEQKSSGGHKKEAESLRNDLETAVLLGDFPRYAASEAELSEKWKEKLSLESFLPTLTNALRDLCKDRQQSITVNEVVQKSIVNSTESDESEQTETHDQLRISVRNGLDWPGFKA